MFEITLVALDDSAQASKVLDAATSLAKMAGGEVRVLHVREFVIGGKAGPYEYEEGSDAHRIVDDAVAKLSEAGVKASGSVRRAVHGRAAVEILEEAGASGATTIVMGSRGRSDLAGLIVGSTAHKVLHLGSLPVLLVR